MRGDFFPIFFFFAFVSLSLSLLLLLSLRFARIFSLIFRFIGLGTDVLRRLKVGAGRKKQRPRRGEALCSDFFWALLPASSRWRDIEKSSPTFDKALHEARVPHDHVVLVFSRGLANCDYKVATHSVSGHFKAFFSSEQKPKGEREEREKEEFRL